MSVSMPKSPLATMTPSEFSITSSRFDRPSWSSILTKISTSETFFPKNFFNSFKSFFDLQKDKAIKSTPLEIAYLMSFLSLSVRDGRVTFAPGKFTCFLLLMSPESKTSHFTFLSLSIFLIFRSIAPLSKDTLPPFFSPLTCFKLSTIMYLVPLSVFGVK